MCAGKNPHPSLPQQTAEGAGELLPSAEAESCKGLHQGRGDFSLLYPVSHSLEGIAGKIRVQSVASGLGKLPSPQSGRRLDGGCQERVLAGVKRHLTNGFDRYELGAEHVLILLLEF